MNAPDAKAYSIALKDKWMSIKWCESNLMISYVCDLNYVIPTIFTKVRVIFSRLDAGLQEKIR